MCTYVYVGISFFNMTASRGKKDSEKYKNKKKSFIARCENLMHGKSHSHRHPYTYMTKKMDVCSISRDNVNLCIHICVCTFSTSSLLDDVTFAMGSMEKKFPQNSIRSDNCAF